MARSGEVNALTKGSLHGDGLLAEVARPNSGPRAERRISHVFVLDVPRYAKALLITDAAKQLEYLGDARAAGLVIGQAFVFIAERDRRRRDDRDIGRVLGRGRSRRRTHG